MADAVWFIPAEFGLYEFDDRGDTAGRRCFVGWNGLLGTPAEEVMLGWWDSGAAVTVCTTGREPGDTAEARERAAHLALGGDALPIPERPATVDDVMRTIQEIGSDGELWREGFGEGGQVAVTGGFALGYQRLGDVFVFVAAVGVDPSRFAVRPVADWPAYDLDARTELTLGTLKRQRRPSGQDL
jgi:hypothetical protein